MNGFFQHFYFKFSFQSFKRFYLLLLDFMGRDNGLLISFRIFFSSYFIIFIFPTLKYNKLISFFFSKHLNLSKSSIPIILHRILILSHSFQHLLPQQISILTRLLTPIKININILYLISSGQYFHNFRTKHPIYLILQLSPIVCRTPMKGLNL